MPTLLDDAPDSPATPASANRLRVTMAAVRVAFTWLGIRKSLTAAQKEQAADGFGAERTYLSAGKKLLDTSHPVFKAVTSIRNQAIWLLAEDFAAVPGAGNSADPPGRHRPV